MSTQLRAASLALAGLLAANLSSLLAQQPAVRAAVGSKAQLAIDQAAEEGKYAFLVFYKQNDATTQAVTKTLQQALASESERAVLTFAQVGNPAEQALVAKHDVSRAPMPMTLVLAPNGAITGVFAQKLTAENVQDAFVTPTMMATMKSLQESKLVLVTVQGAVKGPAPVAIREFQSDPHFKDRLVSLSTQAADPREAKFMGQMEINPSVKTTYTVLLAPPGVLVGKFDAATSKDEIAAALAKAGKCCDDPNCKHHQPAPATKTTQAPPATRKK